MPKKKKGSSASKIAIVVILIVVLSIAFIGWHDGVIGATSMSKINDGTLDMNTPVTVKGEVTAIIPVLNSVTVADTTGGVSFVWAGADSLSLHTRVVVRGLVFSLHILYNVTSVQPVWVFA